MTNKSWNQLSLTQRNRKRRSTMKSKMKVTGNPMKITTLHILAQLRMLRSPKMARGRAKKAKPSSRSPLVPEGNELSTSTSSVKLIAHRE